MILMGLRIKFIILLQQTLVSVKVKFLVQIFQIQKQEKQWYKQQ